MKKASLIYNPNAGGADQISVEDLQAKLLEIGYDATHLPTAEEKDLDSVLKEIEGVLFVAGGDGTIRSTVTRLINQEKITVAPIPMGTANNIGQTLNVTGDLPAIIASYKDTQTVQYDIGHIIAPWGEDYFLEAFGCGLYADALTYYNPEEGKSVTRALATIREILPAYEAYDWKVTLDDADLSGKYLMLEVLNTASTGPRLRLSPTADPTDGLLDIVGIRENERTQLLEYTTKLLNGTLENISNVEINKGKKFQIVWTGFPVHIDGEYRTEMEDQKVSKKTDTEELSLITVEILPKALRMLLPKPLDQDGTN